jgi:hypothetical protein
MTVRTLLDLCPDGLRIAVPWKELYPGMSIFVPCINAQACQKQAEVIARKLEIRIACRRAFKDNILGLRIWRTP